MSRPVEKLWQIWRDMLFGRMFVSREWWARWDELFTGKFEELEVLIDKIEGPVFPPESVGPVVKKIGELSRVLKGIGLSDEAYVLQEDGGLALSSSARELFRDCIGNELHKIMFLVDETTGEGASPVDLARRALEGIREFIEEFKKLTEEIKEY